MPRYRAYNRDDIIIGDFDATDFDKTVGWAAAVGLRRVARIEVEDGDQWRVIFDADAASW